jgi:membrane associated rhomboid family serine protease
VIPLRDDNPTRRLPWMTILLIAVNVAAFAYEWMLTQPGLDAFLRTWAYVPARYLADPFAPGQIATLFAAMFLHAGPVHILGNMLYLWIFGNNVEDRLGPWLYVAFYLTCGLAATAAQTLVGPDVTIPTLGASGAVAGVLGAYALLYPRAGVVTIIPIFFFFEIARVPALFVIGFWFVLQLANGLASFGPETLQSGGVAWFAHIGGFVAGLLLIIPAWSRQRHSRSRWR